MMRSFSRLFIAEGLKMQKKRLLLLLLIGPLLAILSSLSIAGMSTNAGENKWVMMYTLSVFNYGMIFFPLIAGIFAALLCRYENHQGGWKLLFTWPVSRSVVYFAKFSVLIVTLAISQGIFFLFSVGAIVLRGDVSQIEWVVLGQSIFLGWLAIIPLAALQLWVSFLFKSFGIPLAINVLFTIPNLFAGNSQEYGPWYPWAQPALAMIPQSQVVDFKLAGIIIGGFLLFFIGGWMHFNHRDMLE
ncbi:ABC transporter permease [Marininema halotolerans]|uniref:ABC-2 type transport system permease protein n=1 Tax=Marininema halotolerans TaxID=1155944 RepID=A0A1I6NSK1_9BACL|nr:ABC transporter permease [Marininema halotolerans]SFS30839.1 hypothetical protein SAMN05444972_10183 [Marininema halotolerans]